MKKGRPAHTLSVLASADLRDELVALTLRETTSIGVRWSRWQRRVLDRAIEEVETPYGPVVIKVASDASGVLNAAPEFDSCRERSQAAGVPLKEVYAAAVQAWRQTTDC